MLAVGCAAEVAMDFGGLPAVVGGDAAKKSKPRSISPRMIAVTRSGVVLNVMMASSAPVGNLDSSAERFCVLPVATVPKFILPGFAFA